MSDMCTMVSHALRTYARFVWHSVVDIAIWYAAWFSDAFRIFERRRELIAEKAEHDRRRIAYEAWLWSQYIKQVVEGRSAGRGEALWRRLEKRCRGEWSPNRARIHLRRRTGREKSPQIGTFAEGGNVGSIPTSPTTTLSGTSNDNPLILSLSEPNRLSG